MIPTGTTSSAYAATARRAASQASRRNPLSQAEACATCIGFRLWLLKRNLHMQLHLTGCLGKGNQRGKSGSRRRLAIKGYAKTRSIRLVAGRIQIGMIE